eukprot:1760466-Rhodomonas_salina.6
MLDFAVGTVSRSTRYGRVQLQCTDGTEVWYEDGVRGTRAPVATTFVLRRGVGEYQDGVGGLEKLHQLYANSNAISQACPPSSLCDAGTTPHSRPGSTISTLGSSSPVYTPPPPTLSSNCGPGSVRTAYGGTGSALISRMVPCRSTTCPRYRRSRSSRSRATASLRSPACSARSPRPLPAPYAMSSICIAYGSSPLPAPYATSGTRIAHGCSVPT